MTTTATSTSLTAQARKLIAALDLDLDICERLEGLIQAAELAVGQDRMTFEQADALADLLLEVAKIRTRLIQERASAVSTRKRSVNRLRNRRN